MKIVNRVNWADSFKWIWNSSCLFSKLLLLQMQQTFNEVIIYHCQLQFDCEFVV